jgi:hypothetical protein
MPFGNSQQTSSDTDDETSMKAIKAGSIKISGGTFTINSTDHAIHCTGTIDITGGTFNISSSAGKGISGHGNVTIDGESTSITITKSTEGIESKAVLTINNGTIDITSSDDGLNAGGGSSGFGMTKREHHDHRRQPPIPATQPRHQITAASSPSTPPATASTPTATSP